MKDLRTNCPELASGLCYAVDSFKNENSAKDQVTVQFAQQVEKPGTATNVLLQITQGTEAFAKPIMTTLMSFKREQAEKLGLYPFVKSIIANKVFGINVGVSVIENHTPNPKALNQAPVINPTTGEICMSEGKPVYRHTELLPIAQCKREFKTFDKVAATVENAISRIAEPIAD